MDGPATEATSSIASGKTTPPDVANLASTLTKGAQEAGASTPEAIAAALKLAAELKSVPPAEK